MMGFEVLGKASLWARPSLRSGVVRSKAAGKISAISHLGKKPVWEERLG
jgi:hypothetical protein